jgi:drug/metabolite transporter (DMT)-like permease
MALATKRQELAALPAKDRPLLLGAGVFLAIHFATWIASIGLTSLASSVLLVTSTPIWVALAARVLGERLTPRAWGGIVLAILGGAVVALAPRAAQDGSGGAFSGNLLAVAGAVSIAGYLLIGRRLRGGLSLLGYVSIVYGVCAVILLVVALVSGTALTGFSAKTWLVLVAIAAGPQLTAHTILNFLLRDLEAWKVATATLGEPIGASIIAVLLFSEIPGPLVVPGGLLLLAGIWISLSARKRTAEVVTVG